MIHNEIITLYTFKDLVEATLAHQKLKANGIDSFLENENPVGLNPLGGVELKIFLRDKEKAEKIMEQ